MQGVLWPPGNRSVSGHIVLREELDELRTYACIAAIVQCSQEVGSVVGVVLHGVAELLVARGALRAGPDAGIGVVGGEDVAGAGGCCVACGWRYCAGCICQS